MSFYKMERGWLDSDVWGGQPYSEREAFEWMIGEAHFTDTEKPLFGKRVKLKRGQFSHSVRFMADKFKWSKDKVHRFLKKLELWDMIKTENATGQNIITICNYSKYQGKRDSDRDSNQDASATGARQERDKEEEILEVQEVLEGKEAPALFTEKELTQFRKQCPSLTEQEFLNQVTNCEIWINAHGSKTPELTLSKWLQRAEQEKPKIPLAPDGLNQMREMMGGTL